MFAAMMMAGGTFTLPRLTTSPTVYDETGSSVVSFAPPIGVTTLYIDANAGGGMFSTPGGGQGARVENLSITCASNDSFELTFTTESGRGKRIKLVQNSTTLFDLRGGTDSGVGGDAVTPSLTGGAVGTAFADPGTGASTSHYSGTAYSGSGGWNLNSPGASAYLASYFPDAGVTYYMSSGMGAKSREAGNSPIGFEPGWGASETEDIPFTGYFTIPADIASITITW